MKMCVGGCFKEALQKAPSIFLIVLTSARQHTAAKGEFQWVLLKNILASLEQRNCCRKCGSSPCSRSPILASLFINITELSCKTDLDESSVTKLMSGQCQESGGWSYFMKSLGKFVASFPSCSHTHVLTSPKVCVPGWSVRMSCVQ